MILAILLLLCIAAAAVSVVLGLRLWLKRLGVKPKAMAAKVLPMEKVGRSAFASTGYSRRSPCLPAQRWRGESRGW